MRAVWTALAAAGLVLFVAGAFTECLAATAIGGVVWLGSLAGIAKETA